MQFAVVQSGDFTLKGSWSPLKIDPAKWGMMTLNEKNLQWKSLGLLKERPNPASRRLDFTDKADSEQGLRLCFPLTDAKIPRLGQDGKLPF